MDSENLQQADITKKLGEISEIMGDGYIFVKMRMSAERWENETNIQSSVELLDIINRFHKLCVVMRDC